MTFAQYSRIETKAGGVSCSPREFIKAAHTLLSPRGKSLAMRDIRHNWLRNGLAYRADAQTLYRKATS